MTTDRAAGKALCLAMGEIGAVPRVLALWTWPLDEAVLPHSAHALGPLGHPPGQTCSGLLIVVAVVGWPSRWTGRGRRGPRPKFTPPSLHPMGSGSDYSHRRLAGVGAGLHPKRHGPPHVPRFDSLLPRAPALGPETVCQRPFLPAVLGSGSDGCRVQPAPVRGDRRAPRLPARPPAGRSCHSRTPPLACSSRAPSGSTRARLPVAFAGFLGGAPGPAAPPPAGLGPPAPPKGAGRLVGIAAPQAHVVQTEQLRRWSSSSAGPPRHHPAALTLPPESRSRRSGPRRAGEFAGATLT